MYLHIGNDNMINSQNIIGIFDIDICTIEQRLRDFLSEKQRKGDIVDVAEDLPGTFIVTNDKVYISGLSSTTLRQRVEHLNNRRKNG